MARHSDDSLRITGRINVQLKFRMNDHQEDPQTDLLLRQSGESTTFSRRLHQLREQLRRENRRAAGPFSHRLAADGPLWKLREQIRDVSRLAEAILISLDEAPETRRQEMCSDLRRLIVTQSKWTERLENQIWRMESQMRLMRRLHETLSNGTPCTDQILELCEIIALESLTIPEGLLLLPEPGQRIILPSNGPAELAARCVESARWTVFSGMSLLPQQRGSDLAFSAMSHCTHSWIQKQASAAPFNERDELTRAMANRLRTELSVRSVGDETREFAETIGRFSDAVELRSLSAADAIVPPSLAEFFSSETLQDATSSRWNAVELARSFGLNLPESCSILTEQNGDQKLVLTHKLRWHSGPEESMVDSSAPATHIASKRPHFRIHTEASDQSLAASVNDPNPLRQRGIDS
ncbi:MAG: hypothetical protein JNM43_27370 [Planctomycetaceae bacterium]|nr:hypothetical protein [Planctomycetaceae bacterium]